MYLSLEFEKKFLNTMTGNTLPGVANVYCGLFLSDPTDNNTGIEINYAGYRRVIVTLGTPTAQSGGIGVSNTNEATYPQVPSGAGGTVTYIGLFDSQTGGTMYLHGRLTEPLVLTEGEEPVLIVKELLFYSVGNLSIEYKKKLFNVLRNQSISGFTPYVSLWGGNPEKNGLELSGDNYSRIKLTMSTPAKTPNGQMVIKNTLPVNFNRPTTTWGLWNHDVIMDSLTGGTAVWIKEKTPKSITKGVMPKVAVNAITIGVN